MGLLNFAAPLSVAMSFQWKSDAVAHPLTTKAASKRHILANESVRELAVTGVIGDQATVLRHEVTPEQRYYDPVLNMYTTSPVDGIELERLLDARSHATFTVDLRFTLCTFFDVLLEQMTRSDEDLHNFAHPNDAAAILRTFDHDVEDDEVTFAYHSETHRIQAVPCKLVDIDIKPQTRPQRPAVKLLFEIDFLTGEVAARREAMRKLIAMDWSELARFGGKEPPLPPDVAIWKDNLLVFLANQTDMERAERFRTSIAARHARKRSRRLADHLRKDIDLHIITANHWGETREDPKTERYQALLSDLLATLHQSAPQASPITLSRDLARTYGLSLDQKAAMTLQYGTGYCGEHSRTAFSILRTIMATPGNRIDRIVLCGNANIDHGFVICNLKVTHVILTTATSPENTRVAIGEDITVFNLRDALGNDSGREVLVVDPYLDRSMSAATGDRLLLALNSKKKQERGKDTDFLVFQIQYPAVDDVTVDDIRDRPASERMTLVKNV